jgi:hypothetical protein
MGTPTANVSRKTFDANKSYLRMLLQQGVPITDADINELQDLLDWRTSRAIDTLIGFDTTQVTVDDALYEFVHPVDPTKTWPADAPTVAATPTSWFPGSMRPWVHTAGLSNDFYVMWGPSWVQGLFVEDSDSRGPAGLYSDLGHVITSGKVTALPGGTTFEDDSKDFTPATGSLHLVAPSGGVGNGTDRHARVRFVTGAEAGNTYTISAVPTSARLTVTGPYSAGGPAIGDEYLVLPNSVTFVNGQVEKVWLGVWVEDQDMEEDPDLEEPTMLLEPSHRLRVRYFHRIFRTGANLPTSADRPDYPDLAPQGHEEKVYWIHIATITPGAGAPTIVPANIVYTTPGHYEMAPLGPLTHILKSKFDLGSGKWKDIQFADDVGPGASLAANQHPIIRTSTEGIRFPALAANALSPFIDLNVWDGATSFPLLDAAGWKSTDFGSGWGAAVFANALIARSQQAGNNGYLYLGATTEEVTTSLSGFLVPTQAEGKAWIQFFADDAGATADFLSELTLNANYSQNGTDIGHLTFGLFPNDGDNQAHAFRFQLTKDAGADVTSAYVVELAAPTGVTNGFAGLKIAGFTGTGTHVVQGDTSLHVLSGDVKFGSLGSPTFWFDDSANLLQFSATTGQVNFSLASGDAGLFLDSAGALSRIGKDASTYVEADEGGQMVTLFATDILLAGEVALQENVTLGNNKRYKFASARKLRRMFYMDQWNRNEATGATPFAEWLPTGASPGNPAKYTSVNPPGSVAYWPAALYEGTVSAPSIGFFQILLNPGETLERVVLGVSTASSSWDLLAYKIENDGSVTLVSTNSGETTTAGAGIREVTIDLTTPVTVSGLEPQHVLLHVEFNGVVDANLFYIRTRSQVEDLEEAIGIKDS